MTLPAFKVLAGVKPAAGGGGGGISVVQAGVSQLISTGVYGAVFPASVTDGNTVILCVRGISASSGWTLPSGFVIDQEFTATDTAAVMSKLSDGTEGDTFSATLGANVRHMVMGLEVSGVATSSPFDVWDTSNNTGTSLALGPTATTAIADSIAVAAVFHSGGTSAESFSDSFVTQELGVTGESATKILTATGTPSTTASWTTSRTNLGFLAVYKGA